MTIYRQHSIIKLLNTIVPSLYDFLNYKNSFSLQGTFASDRFIL